MPRKQFPKRLTQEAKQELKARREAKDKHRADEAEALKVRREAEEKQRAYEVEAQRRVDAEWRRVEENLRAERERRHADRERKKFNDFVLAVRSTSPTPLPSPHIATLVSSETYVREFGFSPINAEIVNFVCEFFIAMLRRWGNLHVLSVYSGVALVERQIHDRVCDEFFALECTDTGAESNIFSEPFLPIAPESVFNQPFTPPQECTGRLCERSQSNPSRTAHLSD